MVAVKNFSQSKGKCLKKSNKKSQICRVNPPPNMVDTAAPNRIAANALS